jgi:hypothetical protein
MQALLPRRPNDSLVFGRFDAERLANFRHRCALIGDCGGEFFRRAGINDLSGGREARRNRRVCNDFANVGGNPFASGRRKPRRREYAGETIKRQRLETGFLRGRNIRQACPRA